MNVNPQRAQALFLAALDLPDPAARRQLLDRECAGDANLRQRVEALLGAHDAAGGFGEQPSGPPLAATIDSAVTARPGTLLAGRYKLLEAIGEGGMGTVWVAEQTEPVRRKVAIKLIKAGMDSRSVLARFEAERQALAVMDHPNIAKVFDGGMTEQGRPFFVMEYVKGVPLTEYCDQARLSLQERLKLFVPVCQAVQHAHQKGIIHRDLKPSNILVCLYDGRPVPKVIDFGLAKAMHQSLTEQTLHTAHGLMVGTPLYMSPEQAELNNLDVDTRTDIYSLGVILYELLTGSTPLEKQQLKQAALQEILRLIKEVEPPKPSTRLSGSASLPSLAAQRSLDPSRLSRSVKGELDWIVMKALDKERSRRYETATSLARDVERYLSDEPVEASPPSASYRLRKFVRKHRTAINTAAAFAMVLLLGTVVSTYLAYRAMQAEGDAKDALVAEAKQRKLAEENQQAADQQRIKAEAATQKEAEQRAKAEKARDRTRDVLDAMTSEVTGDSLSTQKEISEEQKKFLLEVLSYYQEFAGEKAPDEQTRTRTANAAFRVGLIESRLGRKEQGIAAFQLAQDGFRSLVADFPSASVLRQNVASSHNNLGILLAELGKHLEAEEQHRQALAIEERLAAEFPNLPLYRENIARSHNNLGYRLRELGKGGDAETHYCKAISIQEGLVSEFPNEPEYRQILARIHDGLGVLQSELSNRGGQETQYRKALALREKLTADFPTVAEYRSDMAYSHNNLGSMLAILENFSEAEGHFRKALAIREKLAADFPAMPKYRQNLAVTFNNLGGVEENLGKQPEALVQYNKALAIREKLAADFPIVPDYRQEVAFSHNSLGNLLATLGNPAEGEEQHRKALAIREKLANDFPSVPTYRLELALSHNNLGIRLADSNKRVEAEEQFRKALIVQEKLVVDFPAVTACRLELANSHTNLGIRLADFGKQAEAEDQFRKALIVQEKLVADFPSITAYRQNLARNHSNLGIRLADLGKRTEAEEQFREALNIQEKLAADFPKVPEYQIELGGSYCNFGILVRSGGRASESLDWFEKATATLGSVHRAEPHVVTAKRFLRNSHAERAKTYAELTNPTEAVKDWDRAVELSPLSEQLRYRASRATSRLQAGLIAEAVAEVDELTNSSKWDAGQWYSFASVYSVASSKIEGKKQEYTDRAMELLQMAVKAGFKDAPHLKQDTDLNPLREREDFKQLLAELEKEEEEEEAKGDSTPNRAPPE